MAPPLNPFLRSFFRSTLPTQCQPISLHILLVPTTEVLLNSCDRESNTSYHVLTESEEFLGSHVLRVPANQLPGPNNPNGHQANARENKSKAKQFSTLNGRTVVVKESWIYANKGFKSLSQAQLLGDAIYYPDAGDGQQWLVYYISRPLTGSFQFTPIIPAVLSDEPSKERRKVLAEASASGSASGAISVPGLPRKKEIKNFGELLSQFPMISRQMTSGLERIIRDFITAHDKPLPKRTSSSRRSSISSQRSTPSISDSLKSSLSGNSNSSTVHPTSLELEPEEESLRTGLENAVTSAIDLFQGVDKHQLSLLGASTELTGPVVERMIERYVTEQLHDQTLFPRVCATRRPDDADLESKVRRMVDVDVSQVGIPLEGGMNEKRMLNAKLGKGVEAFRRMGVSSSPQEMLEILLATQKAITAPEAAVDDENDTIEEREKKMSGAMTINADVLVSMLLAVVIRSGVRHLHSRLLYMRYFIFIDEVESGEQGYALATMEAVLMHLSNAAGGLRKASKRNRAMWQAARSGDVQALEAILQPDMFRETTSEVADERGLEDSSDEDDATAVADIAGPSSSAAVTPNGTFAAVGGSLEHVFPFQKPPTPPPEQSQVQTKAKKRVSMASMPRSQSISSGYSSRSHSRAKSMDSAMSATGAGDLSAERLSQTQDAEGNSVLMMAVESGKVDALGFLLSLPAHFRTDFVLDDINADGTTLLSSAVQSGNREITDELITFLEENASEEEVRKYLALQDSRGRCVAHYLFNQPHLLHKFGKKLPWRLKDKNGQTPLFALCRSYDHSEYHQMVSTALSLAQQAQPDGQPLHLDDHVDAKGNTLLHIVNETSLTLRLLRHCDSDVNAGNDKRFTPIMVSSKYGRIDHVRALFGDPRVDMTLRDLRGLSAVELAKDDDVRNRIDDMVLLSSPPMADGRITTIVRSFFVEDSTVRLVLKSAAPNHNGSVTVSTSRRSVADFENLARWLSIECPASWLPTGFNLPSPFLIPSKPSRAVLRDTQLRLDNFFRNLLSHATFGTHELVWEFFLVPDMSPQMLEERSRLKAASRIDKIREEYLPISVHETQEVENFVAFARDQVKAVTSSSKKALRTLNKTRQSCNDLSEATGLLSKAWSTLLFLPDPHSRALDRYAKTLVPSDASPLTALYYALHSTHSTSTALQIALNRPAYLISTMQSTQSSLLATLQGLQRSNRWTPSLFEASKVQNREEAERKLARGREEVAALGRELRYTQQTVAGELAGWWEGRAGEGRRVVREFAKRSLVRERARLQELRRVLGEVRRVGEGD
ncbi:hypothetical protein MBLNU230_g1103t1 [Neophaeotheca triangularis]